MGWVGLVGVGVGFLEIGVGVGTNLRMGSGHSRGWSCIEVKVGVDVSVKIKVEDKVGIMIEFNLFKVVVEVCDAPKGLGLSYSLITFQNKSKISHQ